MKHTSAHSIAQYNQYLLRHFCLIPSVSSEAITFSGDQSLRHGLSEPLDINSFLKRKEVSVMGLGTTVDEAFSNAVKRIEQRRTKRTFDIAQLNNGIILHNGSLVYYHLAGYLLKKSTQRY